MNYRDVAHGDIIDPILPMHSSETKETESVCAFIMNISLLTTNKEVPHCN